MPIRIQKWFGMIFVAGMITACASAQVPTRFFDPSKPLVSGRFFKQEYVNPSADFAPYHKIKISAVNLKYLDAKSQEKFSSEVIRNIALEFRETVESQIRERSEFFVLEDSHSPDQETLMLELALVGVNKPLVLLNIATTFFLGPTISSGYAVFEAKITDGQTGELLAEVSEKRKGGALKRDGSIFLRSMITGPYTELDHARAAFEFWGQKLGDFLAAQKLGEYFSQEKK